MKELLEKIKSIKILVIGDIILDHYVWGDVNRISPEAPVPVLLVKKDTHVAGGAANVALNIASLGGTVSLSGSMGNDEAGKQLRSILESQNIQLDLIAEQTPTIVKTRVIAHKQQVCRLDREENPLTYSLEHRDTFKQLEAALINYDAIIFSDYAKGVISEGLVSSLNKIAQAKGKITAMDPKPHRPIPFSNVSLLTPNKKESFELAGIEEDPYSEFPADIICRTIWERYHPKNLIITLGSQGMLLSQEGKVTQHIPTFAKDVYDVSGAGDTVIAALTLGLAAGASLDETAKFANTAAGIVVSKFGTATVTPDEILRNHRL